MKIEISSKLRPFSHLPGTSVLLPSTTVVFTIYPAEIIIRDFGKVSLDVVGPVLDFTIQQDLERREIHVFGTTKRGYIHYKIRAIEGGFEFCIIKDKTNSLLFEPQKYSCDSMAAKAVERLSFGVHKSQNWDLVNQRLDLKEILPHLFSLGQLLPVKRELPIRFEDFLELYLACFDGIMAPKIKKNLGVLISKEIEDNPFSVLPSFTKAIRTLFVQEAGEKLFILPKLPPSFPCGRMITIEIAKGLALLNLEWTKKKIFKVMIKAKATVRLEIHFPSNVHQFRVRSTIKERGVQKPNGTHLEIDEGKTLFLDRFT